ncbi:unnamed protein product [Prorocentrum cordatum]|uniref:Uncharacterized protein n=1 Tax=Prorocentrum cordatum TaxID=2364126 RepID=A0ABN9S672_9DINO|nr:unnamed protein product [Polarella glacialis]
MIPTLAAVQQPGTPRRQSTSMRPRSHSAGRSRFYAWTPQVSPRRPKIVLSQVGPSQLGLPGTMPCLDHTGIDFVCSSCGVNLVKHQEIHQLKVGTIWSRRVPDTAFADESKTVANDCSTTRPYKVGCARCQGRGHERNHIGSVTFESCVGLPRVPDKVFPMILCRHVVEFRSKGWRAKQYKHSVPTGDTAQVKCDARSANTLEKLDPHAPPGEVRQAPNVATPEGKRSAEELQKLLSEEVEEHQKERQERQKLERALEELSRRTDEEKERWRRKEVSLEVKCGLLDDLIADKQAELERLQEQRDTVAAVLQEQRSKFDQERRSLLQEFEASRRELEACTQEEKLKREQIEGDCERRIQEFYRCIDSDREKLRAEKEDLLKQLRLVERKKAELERKAEEGPDAEANAHVEKLSACSVYSAAERSLKSLKLDSRLLSRLHDRCYCPECYPSDYPDVIKNDGPREYVVPRGWVRFGLQVPAQAHVNDVWQRWCVSYHGLSAKVAPIVVRQGDLLFPGDTLPDGTTLDSVNCAGRRDKCTYTSPTIRYSGLAFYANPARTTEGRMFQVVLQCRQEPGTFDVQAETMNFKTRWNNTDLCPHVKWTEIEWVSKRRKTIVPYGLLIRTFPSDSPPEQYYRSPVDKGRF